LTNKIWTGGLFLKNEGGYEIILKSLEHYKKRLKTISNSPELRDSAAMFSSVLNQEAMKTIPKIEEVIKKIRTALLDEGSLDTLIEEIPFMQKSLVCYESDINKARDTGHEYFLRLIGDMRVAEKDMTHVKNAQKKIAEFL
jgi:hypothetical protein